MGVYLNGGFFMNTEFNKKQVIKYLIFTFGIAYAIQIIAWLLYSNGQQMIGQLIVAVMMFVPMLSVLLSGGKIKSMGWNPHIKQNWKTILIAWFSPLILTAIGAGLYFALFPSHFDLSGSYIAEVAGEDALRQLEEQGLSYPLMILLSCVNCVTYAPVINALFAAGEEVGWRGFLYPQLKAKFGKRKGWFIGGMIWGLWHCPLIWLIGYEYGTDYIGFPITGMILFSVVITVALGIIFDWSYEKSNSIWLPAVFHGAFNAAATIPPCVTITNTGSCRLLGSTPIGLIAGLPFIIFAIILFIKAKNTREK